MKTRSLILTGLAVASIQATSAAQIVFLESGTEQDTAAPYGHGGSNSTVDGQDSFIGGGYYNSTFDDYCVVGGGDGNTAGTDDAIVSTAWYATVIGGQSNSSAGLWSVVGGGFNSEVTGALSVVAGGRENTVSGDYSVVLGGYSNDISGNYSVAAGRNCTSSGNYSFVAGRDGTDGGFSNTFVWAGGTGNRNSAGEDTFNVWAANGIYFNGSVVHSSDRNMKEDFTRVNALQVLDKVAALPITTWRFKTESEDIQHVGPVSQDFHEAFGYNGADDRHIAATDADGVSMVAIQGMYQKLIAQQITTRSATGHARTIEARLQALENQR